MVVVVVGDYSDPAVDEPFFSRCGQALALERGDWVGVVGEVVACVYDVAEEHAAVWACKIGSRARREVVEDLLVHCCCCLKGLMLWLDDRVGVGGANPHILLFGVDVLGGDVPNRVWRLVHVPRLVGIRRLRFILSLIPF